MPLSDHLERNLLEIPIPASGRVDVYPGVARLSGATWASEVRLRGHQPTRRAGDDPPHGQLPWALRPSRPWPNWASAPSA